MLAGLGHLQDVHGDSHEAGGVPPAPERQLGEDRERGRPPPRDDRGISEDTILEAQSKDRREHQVVRASGGRRSPELVVFPFSVCGRSHRHISRRSSRSSRPRFSTSPPPSSPYSLTSGASPRSPR